MSIHWKLLSTPQKIEAVVRVYEPGMSASQIAAHFDGVTRNAVIGLYHRHAEKLADCPLLPHGRPATKRSWKPRAKNNTTLKRSNITGLLVESSKPKPIRIQAQPQQQPMRGGFATAGRPLMLLGCRQCRWPVNDAEPGELHLFCSAPAEKTYCDAHHALSFTEPRKSVEQLAGI